MWWGTQRASSTRHEKGLEFFFQRLPVSQKSLCVYRIPRNVKFFALYCFVNSPCSARESINGFRNHLNHPLQTENAPSPRNITYLLGSTIKFLRVVNQSMTFLQTTSSRTVFYVKKIMFLCSLITLYFGS